MVGTPEDLLAGLRVVDLSNDGIPLAGKLLSDLGASVVRVVSSQNLAGSSATAAPERSRYIRLREEMLHGGQEVWPVESWTRSALEQLGILLSSSNAVLVEFPRRDGLDMETLWELTLEENRPALIIVSMSGEDGDGQPPLFELLLQANSGLLYETGDHDRPPCRVGGQIARGITAAEAAVSALCSVLLRPAANEVHLSAQAALAASTGISRLAAVLSGEHWERYGPGELRAGKKIGLRYEAKDGFVVFPYHPTNMLARTAVWLESSVTPLSESDRGSLKALLAAGIHHAEQADIDAVQAAIGRMLSPLTRNEIVRESQRRGIPSAPVATPHEVASDEHLAVSGILEWSVGERLQANRPYRIERSPLPEASPTTPPPGNVGAERDAAPPLTGLRVLAFTTFLAGPVLGKRLADLGAEVIRIESRRAPDFVRHSPPVYESVEGVVESAHFANVNAGVKSAALEMDDAANIAVVKRLLASCDVLIENSRPGLLEKWGLDVDTLWSLRPDMIIVRMSGMGQIGPYSSYRAVGHSLMALSGHIDLTGWPDRAPAMTNMPTSDYIAPSFALLATLSALWARKSDGRGALIDLSQFGALVFTALDEILASRVLDSGITRQGQRDPLDVNLLEGVFTCKDEAWVAVVDVDGRSHDLFRTDAAVKAQTWEDQMSRLAAGYRAEEFVAALSARGVAATRVLSPWEVGSSGVLEKAGYYRQLANAGSLPCPLDGPPVAFGQSPATYDCAPLGRDTEWALSLVSSEAV